ncbi:MAG: hypothetical protein FJ267_19625, partial [Planctomycetes bacterium]|nr:hypothetical protein [Planctomycetota bacterium]
MISSFVWELFKMLKSGLASLWIFCVIAVFAIGCGKKSNETPVVDVDSPSPTSSTPENSSKESQKLIPINREPKSLEGNWVIVFTQDGRDVYAMLLRLSKGSDGTSKAEILDARKANPKPEILDVAIEDKNVSFKIKNANTDIEFQGRFDGTVVRGTLMSNLNDVLMARLLNTDVEDLTDYAFQGFPPASDAFEALIKGMTEKPDVQKILELAKERKTSPISYETLMRMLGISTRINLSEDEQKKLLERIIECAREWGDRQEVQAELISANHLVFVLNQPEEGLQHLNRAMELSGNIAEQIQGRAEPIRSKATIDIALKESRSDSE